MGTRFHLLTAGAIFVAAFGIAPAMQATLITYTTNGTFVNTISGSNALQGQSFTATTQVDSAASGTIVSNPNGHPGTSDTFTIASNLSLTPGLLGFASFSDPASVLTITDYTDTTQDTVSLTFHLIVGTSSIGTVVSTIPLNLTSAFPSILSLTSFPAASTITPPNGGYAVLTSFLSGTYGISGTIQGTAPSGVPEPGTISMVLGGLAIAGFGLKRKKSV